MRILVLSNFFPPQYIGGYELGCHDAVEALKARGHEVKVLTSIYGVERPESNGEVYRWLATDIGWRNWEAQGLLKYTFRLLKKELNNRKCLKKICDTFRPDVIYIWKLTNTSISLAHLAKDSGFPVCFYVFDHWLNDWESDDLWYGLWYRSNENRFFRMGKKPLIILFEIMGLLRGTQLDLHHVQFASEFLKQNALHAGKPVEDAPVIPWGIDIHEFPYNQSVHNPVRLLYAGQIIPIKGVHTVIEAVRILIKEQGYSDLTLTIVGGSRDSEYLDSLKNTVTTRDLEKNIQFRGFIPHEKILSEYQNHDILVFPSIWDEPFGITLLEAMSCGLGVITTATGGSAEIVTADETTALLFPREDAKACASQIRRFLENPRLLEKIRQSGRKRVEKKFTIDRTIELIEGSLFFAISS